MFITETYAAEYIRRYVEENLEKFRDRKITIITVCEQGIHFLELLREHGLDAVAFADTNEKVLGKKICGLPVVEYGEIDRDSLLVVSSAVTAYHDRDDLLGAGYEENQIMTLYPDVIEYFREGFEQIDREHYAGLTKEQNDSYVKEEKGGAIEVRSLPTMLILDLTTRCNLNCRHCEAHHNKDVSRIRNREENYMKPSRYKHLLDYANSVYLNISGEPLMTKKFWEVLDYIDASDNDPNLFTVTNGILLNEKAADRIVHSKFKRLFISMDASTDKTYRRLRGGDFGVWRKNVKYLAEAKKQAGSNLRIVLQHTISREALEETLDAVKLAEELGVDEIIIRPLYTDIAGKDTWLVPMDEERDYYYPQQDAKYYPHLVKEQVDKVKEYMQHCKVKVDISDRFIANLNMEMEDFPYPCSIEEFRKLEEKNKKYLTSQTLDSVPEKAREFPLCDGPWVLAMIFTNGNIMYCNRMAQAEGNLNFSSIYELRNSKAVQDIRKGLMGEDNDISWHCYFCSGCARSDYAKHLKKPIVKLSDNTVLDFHIDNTENLKKISYTGLSRIQRDGTWNNLDDSEITMYLEKTGENYRLEFDMEAFVIPGLVDEQEVEVRIGDAAADTWTFTDDRRCVRSVEVRDDVIEDDGRVTVRLSYKNGVSPISLGIGRDDRKRAVFIHKITIRQA